MSRVKGNSGRMVGGPGLVTVGSRRGQEEEQLAEPRGRAVVLGEIPALVLKIGENKLL